MVNNSVIQRQTDDFHENNFVVATNTQKPSSSDILQVMEVVFSHQEYDGQESAFPVHVTVPNPTL